MSDEALGDQEPEPEPEDQNLGSKPEDGFRKKRPVQERISELVSQRKEAEARFNQTVDMVRDLSNQNRILLEELKNSRTQAPPKPGMFDSFEVDELYALQSQYIDKDSENYNPAKASMVIKEIIRREKDSIRKELKDETLQRNSLEQKKLQAFYDAVRSLGEDGEAFLQNSPQRRLANEEFEHLKERFGEAALTSPEYQRVAVLSAYAKWLKQNPPGQNGLNQIEQKRRAKDALSSGLDAELGDEAEIKSLYAQGQAKKALARSSSIIQEMSNNLKSLSGKR